MYRQTGATQPADLLIEGVESLQIPMPKTPMAIASPMCYRAANAVANWDNVLSVSLAHVDPLGSEQGTDIDTKTYRLLPAAVGGQVMDPVDDRRMRMVFTTTIALRNRAL